MQTDHLGIEGGGTRSIALWADAHGRILHRRESGPLNIKLATDAQILRRLREFTQYKVSVVSLCIAGCRIESDRKRVRVLAASVWPQARCVAGSDLDSGFAVAFGPQGSGILLISGTGSSVLGRDARGASARAGGWGHILGDGGSAYWIAMANLQSQVLQYDHTGKTGHALQKVLRRLCLNTADDLMDWVHAASKSDIAALADELMNADPAILSEAAERLATDCAAVAAKLRMSAPKVALTGGVFAHHPKFFKLTARKIRVRLPRAQVLMKATRTSSRRGAHSARST